MSWHIVCLAGPTDRYTPALVAGDALLRVPFDTPGDVDAPQERLAESFAAAGVALSPTAADLLRAAIGAYAADVRVPRQSAHDAWTRDLILHLPVTAAGRTAGVPLLEQLLRFLTGDHWRVMARDAPSGYRPVWGRADGGIRPGRTMNVALFSGGLDSFIGAVDALGRAETPVFVGHHAAGQGATSVSQRDALAHLRDRYGADRIRFLSCWVSIPKGRARATEATTRGRSLLFLALGTALGTGLGANRLLVPENGLISLNVPLTPTRGGSLSTRTTHPHLIALYRQLLAALGLALTVELPYRFATKGEMLRACADQELLAAAHADTMSCAHPSAGRFAGSGAGRRHCGYCYPCLIRRAAIASWGPDPTPYAYPRLDDTLTPGRRADLRAVRLALARYARRPATLSDLLTAGPLPGSAEEHRAYLGAFHRGMGELAAFARDGVPGRDDAPH